MDVQFVRNGNVVVMSKIDDSPIDYGWLESIKEQLSFTYKSRQPDGSTAEEIRYMCKESEDHKQIYFSYGLLERLRQYLKKHKCNMWLKTITNSDRRYDRLAPDVSAITPDMFRARQDECFKAIINSPCGVIQAPTGFGKTYLLGLLCNAYPNSKIHICTKSVKLVKEIYQRLSKVVDSIGMVGGGKRDLSKRVTIFTADSLGYSNGDAAFFFYDECHTAAAPTYVEKIMQLYLYSRRYGFTATPEGRSDGADALLEMLFGPMIFSMTYDDGVKNGLVSEIKVRWIVCNQAPSRGLNCSSPVYRNRYCIWENDFRNKLIADDIRKHYPGDVKILVLVATVAHAFALKQHLPEFELNYASIPDDTLQDCIRKGWCSPSFTPMKVKEKEKLFEDFLSGKVKRVISTDVWNTGIDVPDLAVVYNVSGRNSQILNTQGAGRASRLFDGKEFGQVVDVRDTYAEYGSYAYSRYSQYKKLGWEQENFFPRFIKRSD